LEIPKLLHTLSPSIQIFPESPDGNPKVRS
jgi:hypothetical protein